MSGTIDKVCIILSKNHRFNLTNSVDLGEMHTKDKSTYSHTTERTQLTLCIRETPNEYIRNLLESAVGGRTAVEIIS